MAVPCWHHTLEDVPTLWFHHTLTSPCTSVSPEWCVRGLTPSLLCLLDRSVCQDDINAASLPWNKWVSRSCPFDRWRGGEERRGEVEEERRGGEGRTQTYRNDKDESGLPKENTPPYPQTQHVVPIFKFKQLSSLCQNLNFCIYLKKMQINERPHPIRSIGICFQKDLVPNKQIWCELIYLMYIFVTLSYYFQFSLHCWIWETLGHIQSFFFTSDVSLSF